NAGAPKLAEPLANPTDYFEMGFLADPTQEYKLWIRLKAEDDNWANDSVFVQFTGAKDAAGNPIYQIGTTSPLAVNLEECSGSGWGLGGQRKGRGYRQCRRAPFPWRRLADNPNSDERRRGLDRVGGAVVGEVQDGASRNGKERHGESESVGSGHPAEPNIVAV